MIIVGKGGLHRSLKVLPDPHPGSLEHMLELLCYSKRGKQSRTC